MHFRSHDCVMLWRPCRTPYELRRRIWTPNKSKLPEIPGKLVSRWVRSSSTTQTSIAPLVKGNYLLADAQPSPEQRLHSDVRISGLIRSIRKQKRAAFAHVSDGTTLAPLQAVLSPEQAVNLNNGAYVELQGKWQKSLGKGQSHELQVTKVLSAGASNPDENPIQKKYQPQDYLRTVPHLRIRTPFNSLLIRVRSHVIQSIGSFLANEGLTQVHPPLITSSDCEGAGEVFTIASRTTTQSSESQSADDALKQGRQYFREQKYLTVSSQLHLEAFSAELGNVWTLSPTFRAEESDTPRHLSEFYMLEAEYRDLSGLECLMDRVENLVRHVVGDVRKHRLGQELLDYYQDPKHGGQASPEENLLERWDSLTGANAWRRVTHSQAVKELKIAYNSDSGHLFNTRPSFQQGLQLEHERWIVKHLGDGMPVFVTDYPKSAKPFYMSPSTAVPDHLIENDQNSKVACFDLLLPFGYCEVVGGSLREHRLEQLIHNMRQQGLLKKRAQDASGKDADYPFLRPGEDLGNLKWYADLRRFGSSPHGGFGLGFDRFLGYMAGVRNLRDIVAFPRTWGRADC